MKFRVTSNAFFVQIKLYVSAGVLSGYPSLLFKFSLSNILCIPKKKCFKTSYPILFIEGNKYINYNDTQWQFDRKFTYMTFRARYIFICLLFDIYFNTTKVTQMYTYSSHTVFDAAGMKQQFFSIFIIYKLFEDGRAGLPRAVSAWLNHSWSGYIH